MLTDLDLSKDETESLLASHKYASHRKLRTQLHSQQLQIAAQDHAQHALQTLLHLTDWQYGKQTADFAGHRARQGLPVAYEEIPGADHFTIMNEMASPAGRITSLIRQLFERTG